MDPEETIAIGNLQLVTTPAPLSDEDAAALLDEMMRDINGANIDETEPRPAPPPKEGK